MSGIIANTPQPQSAYNASKAGVILLTKSLAGEWAKRGVRANSISPGYVVTEITNLRASMTEWYQKWLEVTPMGRPGEVSEVASAVLYLGSDASISPAATWMDGRYTSW